jgi:hypothetical protein
MPGAGHARDRVVVAEGLDHRGHVRGQDGDEEADVEQRHAPRQQDVALTDDVADPRRRRSAREADVARGALLEDPDDAEQQREEVHRDDREEDREEREHPHSGRQDEREHEDGRDRRGRDPPVPPGRVRCGTEQRQTDQRDHRADRDRGDVAAQDAEQARVPDDHLDEGTRQDPAGDVAHRVLTRVRGDDREEGTEEREGHALHDREARPHQDLDERREAGGDEDRADQQRDLAPVEAHRGPQDQRDGDGRAEHGQDVLESETERLGEGLGDVVESVVEVSRGDRRARHSCSLSRYGSRG